MKNYFLINQNLKGVPLTLLVKRMELEVGDEVRALVKATSMMILKE